MNRKTFETKLSALFMLLVMLFGGFSFVACGDDDKEEPEQITDAARLVGSWEVTHEDVYTQIAFNSNGTYIAYTVEDGVREVEEGTYRVDGSRLYLYSADDETEVMTFYFKNDKLYLVQDGKELALTRVK